MLDEEDTANQVVVDVLIVDDDRDVRDSLADLLSEWGFAVGWATNGQEALGLVDAGVRPRVILLDLTMPVLDGRGFLRERKAHPVLAGVPVIVLTADDERPRLSVEAMLGKPVRGEVLLKTIRSVWRPTGQAGGAAA
jgi:CheY-like chemotaxis protein